MEDYLSNLYKVITTVSLRKLCFQIHCFVKRLEDQDACELLGQIMHCQVVVGGSHGFPSVEGVS